MSNLRGNGELKNVYSMKHLGLTQDCILGEFTVCYHGDTIGRLIFLLQGFVYDRLQL